MSSKTAIFAHALLIAYCIMASESQWVEINDPPLPRRDMEMACAAYDDTIFIMGGHNGYYQYQMTEYIISEDQMIDHGSYAMEEKTYGIGHYYTQWEHTLYVFNKDRVLSVYDLSTNNFHLAPLSISVPDIVNNVGSCIAASASHIFITGGFNSNAFQIYDLQNGAWYNGTQMQQKRVDHSCIVVSQFLYVIGDSAADQSNRIEKINVNYFASQPWQYISDGLQRKISWTACVLRNAIIWIIGGADRWVDPMETLDTVYTINTIDDSVTLLSDRLAYGVNRAATIIVNNTLYVFGGNNGSGGSHVNSWMRYDIRPTPNPTKNPSSNPSASFNPSLNPSIDPSFHPSLAPSKLATVNPSFLPSLSPTSNPSTLSPQCSNCGSSGEQNTERILYQSLYFVIPFLVVVILCLIIRKMRTKKREKSGDNADELKEVVAQNKKSSNCIEREPSVSLVGMERTVEGEGKVAMERTVEGEEKRNNHQSNDELESEYDTQVLNQVNNTNMGQQCDPDVYVDDQVLNEVNSTDMGRQCDEEFDVDDQVLNEVNSTDMGRTDMGRTDDGVDV